MRKTLLVFPIPSPVYAHTFIATRGSFVNHRNLVSALVLTALLTLSTATDASAQVCAGDVFLKTQADVDAFNCSSVRIGKISSVFRTSDK